MTLKSWTEEDIKIITQHFNVLDKDDVVKILSLLNERGMLKELRTGEYAKFSLRNFKIYYPDLVSQIRAEERERMLAILKSFRIAEEMLNEQASLRTIKYSHAAKVISQAMTSIRALPPEKEEG